MHPDVVQIFLGKNGMSLDTRPGISWLKEMVDNIRETEPDMPIYLVQTIYMGDQNGIGGETDGKGRSALNGYYKAEEDEKVFLWTKAMDEAFGEMEQVYLIPAALTFEFPGGHREGECQKLPDGGGAGGRYASQRRGISADRGRHF